MSVRTVSSPQFLVAGPEFAPRTPESNGVDLSQRETRERAGGCRPSLHCLAAQSLGLRLLRRAPGSATDIRPITVRIGGIRAVRVRLVLRSRDPVVELEVD